MRNGKLQYFCVSADASWLSGYINIVHLYHPTGQHTTVLVEPYICAKGAPKYSWERTEHFLGAKGAVVNWLSSDSFTMV
jgi:hypothetical protein